MICSLNGEIAQVLEDRIHIDLGSIAFEVFVSRPENFALGKKTKVYIEEILTQDDHYLVGFLTLEEKKAFASLTSVKGIGPKTALSALTKTTPEELTTAIERSDAAYLKKLPGIGPKAASQIILDLKGKLVPRPEKGKAARYPSVASALKGLGFKAKEIEDAILSLDDGIDEAEALRLALRYFAKGKS
ncbi:MAG: Holliday junction branch migration protein RuvA [Candidatus Enteromonas sp.]|nr:Holliday junction branch migration protein RuvA [Candidatus Enteromonas sp.]